MRILYSHRIQSKDGQSVHVEELVAAMRELDHEVEVVGPSFYDDSGFGGESGTVALLRRLLPGALGEAAELVYNVPSYRRLAAVARKFRPDLIYERYNLYYLPGTWLARRLGIPLYLEVNSPLAAERSQHGTLHLQRLAHRLERYVWRRATRVLAVTRVLGDIIVASGAAPDRVRVTPNGVVLNRFPAPEPGPDGPVMLGFVGFVREWHGMDALIRHMATGPANTALTLVGDGPVRAELQTLAQSLGLGTRVTFTGIVEHALVPAAVAAFDIALQPKVTAYASPLKIFDYMAAARAIVAPDQPNIREILTHEQNALLFDPSNPEAMWSAITRLVADPTLRERLGTAARAELERQDYTWAGNARRIAAWVTDERVGQ